MNQSTGEHVLRNMWLKVVFTVICSCLAGLAEAAGQSPLSLGEHQTVQNGVKLWYKVAGQRHPGQAPVLFLHGGPGYNSYSFEETIGAKLEPHMQIVYLDERGSGRSERPASGDYRMASLVEDIEALRRSFNVPQLTLMGHSFGGTIALEYAAKYPQQVQKLIILDGVSDAPRTFALWRSEIQERYPAAWKRALLASGGMALRQAEAQHGPCSIAKAEFAVEMSALHSVDGQAFHNWQQFVDQRYQHEQSVLDNASGLQNTGELSNTYFGSNSEFPCYRFTAYGQLTMPALIIVGKHDGAVGTDQMRRLAAELPNARFDEFDKSAHFVYAEQPIKFVQDLDAFLGSSN